ncbi:MAG: hypothetical protein ACO1QR_05085 [Chthoniobacteraceae bacterium]
MIQSQHRFTALIEPLESRIAPAAVIPTISSDGRTATWSDVDGDLVTLKITKGTLEASNFTLESGPGSGAVLHELNLADPEFSKSNITITASRDEVTGGNNSVNVGFINAEGTTLGAVKISGDLARINAGAAELTSKTAPALKSLSVYSMGLVDDSTLAEPGALTSELSGKVGAITVKSSIKGAFISVSGDSLGQISSLRIGGSLIGTDGSDTGRIVSSGNIGAISIGGNVQGGDGQRSGAIESGGNIASLTINGSIFGGKSDTPENDGSGVVRADGSIGKVAIKGSIVGGTQQDSGVLLAGGNVASITINGSIKGGSAGAFSGAVSVGGDVGKFSVRGITGGAADQSGYVEIDGIAKTLTVAGALVGGGGDESGIIKLGTDAGDVSKKVSVNGDVTGGAGEVSGGILATAVSSLIIGGSLYGGSGEQSGVLLVEANLGALKIAEDIIGGDLAMDAATSLLESAYISAGSIGTAEIGGSIRTGIDYNAGIGMDLINNASIRVANEIGSLVVRGSIEGNSDAHVLITARGQEIVPQNSTKDIAFKTLQIGGSVTYAEILAGFNQNDIIGIASVNPNAQIGKVTVAGDWIASNLVAGAAHSTVVADGTDVKSTGVDNPDITSTIASVIIGGQISGTADTDQDHFGFVAQEIKRFQAASSLLPLNTGAGNDNDPNTPRYNFGSTFDVRLFELGS